MGGLRKGVDPIEVKSVNVLLFGQPGVGKTSIGYTAKRPIVLDFDSGTKRSKQRSFGDYWEMNSWDDCVDFMQNSSKILQDYDTVVIDTVGRAVDFITTWLIQNNPKLGSRNGSLTLNGWGELKGVFTSFIRQLTTLGVDVVMLAHDKESVVNDVKQIRPDIAGGSYAEVIKLSDFAGYLQKINEDTVIDFNPCESYYGKNSAGLKKMKVPDFTTNPTFLADLIDQMKKSFTELDDRQREALATVNEWKAVVEGWTTPEDFNQGMPQFEAVDASLKSKVASCIKARRTELGIEYNATSKEFYFKADGTV
jgi:phage nucleotide-binding protein